MEKLEIKKTYYPYIIITVSLIFVFFLGYFVIKPAYDDNLKKDKSIKNKKEVLNVLKDNEKKLSGLSSQKKDIEDKFKLVSASLPAVPEKSRLYMEIENLAYQSGLSPVSIKEDSEGATSSVSSVSETQAVSSPLPEGVVELKYTADLSGNYDSLKYFLDNSEKALRILKINKVSVKDKGDGNIDASISLSAFYKNDSEVLK